VVGDDWPDDSHDYAAAADTFLEDGWLSMSRFTGLALTGVS
jgi:hypothetical protein